MSPAEPDPVSPVSSSRPADGSPTRLGERDLAILDLEREWWRFAGGKEAAVRERLGLSPGDYHRALARLIDDDATLAHDPLLVRRLRRQRLVRRRERSARRLGTP